MLWVKVVARNEILEEWRYLGGGRGGGELEYYYYIIEWYRYNSLGVDVAIKKKKSIVTRELITLNKFELKYQFFPSTTKN